ncbi:Tyrosine/serine-protein phosphatase IphP-type [Baffinella frigidus]|nr:Tyrosine/serine-protein phosphatase IphP-type [Cryptophyta sp. CCMP2293]
MEVLPDLRTVLNVRDMASVTSSNIKPGRLFRTACVGTAVDGDAEGVVNSFRTLIDLRSEKELSGKTSLQYNQEVWTGKPRAVVPSAADGEDKPLRARHLISLIDEALLKKKLKVGLMLPVDYEGARDVFLEYINKEGLPLLNELILEYSGPSIKAVFDVLQDTAAHPVAFYCTAGKDRTGIIAMLVLSVLGVGREDILNDYVLSDTVYQRAISTQ